MVSHAFREARAYWLFEVAFTSLFTTFDDMRNDVEPFRRLIHQQLRPSYIDYRSRIVSTLLTIEGLSFREASDGYLLRPIQEFFFTLLRVATSILTELITGDVATFLDRNCCWDIGLNARWETFLGFFQLIIEDIDKVKHILLRDPTADVEAEVQTKCGNDQRK